MYEDITVEAYKARFKDLNENHLLLDVRTPEEFDEFRIPGAVNIPLDELMDRADEVQALAGENPIVVVCKSGVRSIMGAQTLGAVGLADHVIYNLDTGTLGWARANLPLESSIES
ncbi:MAG: hypothetical protein OHK0046_35780 [Anaerolineae bacterium]